MRIFTLATTALVSSTALANTYDLVIENQTAESEEIRAYIDFNGNRVMDEGERIFIVGGSTYEDFRSNMTITVGRFIDANGNPSTTFKFGDFGWGTSENVMPNVQNFDPARDGLVPCPANGAYNFTVNGDYRSGVNLTGYYQIKGWTMENMNTTQGECQTTGVYPLDPRPFGRRGSEATWSLRNPWYGAETNWPGYSGISTESRYSPVDTCPEYWALPYISVNDLVLDTETTPWNHQYLRPLSGTYCPQPELANNYNKPWYYATSFWGKLGCRLYEPFIDSNHDNADPAIAGMYEDRIHGAVACESYSGVSIGWGAQTTSPANLTKRVVITLGERASSLIDLNRDMRIEEWEIHCIKQIANWDLEGNQWADARNWDQPSKKFIDWWITYSHMDLNGDGYITMAEDINKMLADFNNDGCVNSEDMGMLFAQWGTNNPRYDLTGDGVVDAADHALILVNWGC